MEQQDQIISDRKIASNPPDIDGWGMDADPENDPTYPMKKWNGADHNRLNYKRPPQQASTVEVLHSNERPGLSSVYGTSAPPSGLSGMLRRFAFKFSEGSSGHWLTLLIADRVNVAEGIVDDLKHGHVPNIFVERGWRAEWKYNRKGAIRSLVIGTAITAGVAAILLSRRRQKTKEFPAL